MHWECFTCSGKKIHSVVRNGAVKFNLLKRMGKYTQKVLCRAREGGGGWIEGNFCCLIIDFLNLILCSISSSWKHFCFIFRPRHRKLLLQNPCLGKCLIFCFCVNVEAITFLLTFEGIYQYLKQVLYAVSTTCLIGCMSICKQTEPHNKAHGCVYTDTGRTWMRTRSCSCTTNLLLNFIKGDMKRGKVCPNVKEWQKKGRHDVKNMWGLECNQIKRKSKIFGNQSTQTDNKPWHRGGGTG